MAAACGADFTVCAEMGILHVSTTRFTVTLCSSKHLSVNKHKERQQKHVINVRINK